ncbi:MAG: cytochrome c oxidase subunit 3 [Actinomycetota bacterium]|nr:cytochrome c oxidase subunit 3 [Actinomycetota bacterium]
MSTETVHSGFRPDMSVVARANRIGLWLFLVSETFLFGAFLSARYFSSGTLKPDELNQGFALALTIILLLSSISAYLAETAMRYNHRRKFIFFMSLTIGMGLLFLVGVGTEISEAIHLYPPETQYGTSYFMLIGLHAFHVVTGLTALGIALFLGIKGHFSSDDYWGVEGVVKYWHFVDLAWVIIYPTLYLF